MATVTYPRRAAGTAARLRSRALLAEVYRHAPAVAGWADSVQLHPQMRITVDVDGVHAGYLRDLRCPGCGAGGFPRTYEWIAPADGMVMTYEHSCGQRWGPHVAALYWDEVETLNTVDTPERAVKLARAWFSRALPGIMGAAAPQDVTEIPDTAAYPYWHDHA